MTNKQKIVGGIAVVLLLVAIGLGVKYGGKKSAVVETKNTETKVGVKQEAPKGELISNFPKELVLDSKATVNNSFTIPYQENTNQSTGSFLSSKSIAEIYQGYLDYAGKNGYNVVNKNISDTMANIYAMNDTASFNMVATKDQASGKTSLVITYLKK